MHKIDTSYIEKCNKTLKQAYAKLKEYKKEDIEYDMYRSATIKEFEIILEQSGKLLKKTITPYFHTNKEADKLNFKDIFRQAGIHGLLNIEEVERWITYRDNRNSTTHDYGEYLANETLELIEPFCIDVENIIKIINAS